MYLIEIMSKIRKMELLHEDMSYGEKSLSFEGKSMYNDGLIG